MDPGWLRRARLGAPAAGIAQNSLPVECADSLGGGRQELRGHPFSEIVVELTRHRAELDELD